MKGQEYKKTGLEEWSRKHRRISPFIKAKNTKKDRDPWSWTKLNSFASGIHVNPKLPQNGKPTHGFDMVFGDCNDDYDGE